jgi:hypothetical protein
MLVTPNVAPDLGSGHWGKFHGGSNTWPPRSISLLKPSQRTSTSSRRSVALSESDGDSVPMSPISLCADWLKPPLETLVTYAWPSSKMSSQISQMGDPSLPNPQLLPLPLRPSPSPKTHGNHANANAPPLGPELIMKPGGQTLVESACIATRA